MFYFFTEQDRTFVDSVCMGLVMTTNRRHSVLERIKEHAITETFLAVCSHVAPNIGLAGYDKKKAA